jgi:hypothetical protein
MPIWLIEFFGARDLENTFILIALMTAPVWVAMIALPDSKYVRGIAQPFIVTPIFCFVLIVLLWKSYQASILPEPMETATYGAARDFAEHPITFLALFCNLQILNLVLGTMIYQKARRSGFRAPIELALCWMLGALALIPFVIRLLVRRKSLT